MIIFFYCDFQNVEIKEKRLGMCIEHILLIYVRNTIPVFFRHSMSLSCVVGGTPKLARPALNADSNIPFYQVLCTDLEAMISLKADLYTSLSVIV